MTISSFHKKVSIEQSREYLRDISELLHELGFSKQPGRTIYTLEVAIIRVGVCLGKNAPSSIPKERLAPERYHLYANINGPEKLVDEAHLHLTNYFASLP